MKKSWWCLFLCFSLSALAVNNAEKLETKATKSKVSASPQKNSKDDEWVPFHPGMPNPAAPQKKNIKLEKTKSGLYKASWDLLSLLDLKTRKPTKDLKKVINQKVEAQGFMIPLDFDSKEVSEFLLVSYVPSCMHVPPPPENQIIHVKLKKGKKTALSFNPVKVDGKLIINTKRQDAFFILQADKLTEVKRQ